MTLIFAIIASIFYGFMSLLYNIKKNTQNVWFDEFIFFVYIKIMDQFSIITKYKMSNMFSDYFHNIKS